MTVGVRNNMRIIVVYMYIKNGKCFEREKIFTDRVKALRFIKMVDGDNFNGFVMSWECDCADDNEWLFQRHTIRHPITGGVRV